MAESENIEITPEEIAEQEQHRDRWIQHALCTDPADRAKAERAMTVIYEKLNKLEKPTFEWYDSPVQISKRIFELNNDGDEKGDKGSNLDYAYRPYMLGQHEANWLAYYTYARHIGVDFGKEKDIIIDAWVELAQSTGWIYAFVGICFMCERPLEFHLHPVTHVLHRDGGPAVSYRDGTKIHYSNNVVVPEWLACKAPDDIDASKITTLSNVEVRAQFIRKVGMARICTALKSETLDEKGDYKLLRLHVKITNGPGNEAEEDQIYLQMTNPSTGQIHAEAVPPDTRTVKAALTFRNGTDAEPVVLT